MNSLDQRLKKAMGEMSGNPGIPQLAKIGAVSYHSAAKWYDGSTKSIRAEALHRIATWLGVNARWLATGEGPMRPNEQPTKQLATLIKDIQSHTFEIGKKGSSTELLIPDELLPMVAILISLHLKQPKTNATLEAISVILHKLQHQE